MNRKINQVLGAIAISIIMFNSYAEEVEKNTVVKSIQSDYQNWSLFAISHRLDKKTLRAILANEIAIKAVKQHQMNPWTNGSILTKVVWKETTHPQWSQAIVPGAFEKAEVMIKDAQKYPTMAGWGFGYWEGKKLVMYEENKAKECFACHQMVKDNDYVFNAPVFP
ncbi:MAG: hypothetical protein RL637_100 [Pseudomonadota bacterium]|jgi:hypothetical protein